VKLKIPGSMMAAWVIAFCLQSSCEAQDCSNTTEQNRSSVVYLHVEKTTQNTGATKVLGATGFVVSSSGVVLTNRHVVKKDTETDEVIVSGAIGSQAGQLRTMHVLATSDSSDTAALQFDDTSQTWRPVSVGNPWPIDVGHPLCSMSFPLNIEFLIARGNVSGKGAPNGWWYSDMPSNPGDSGAPVFDAADGKVIAIKVGDRDDAKNLSYLIPINIADPLLRTYAGISVPEKHEMVDSAKPSAYTNSNISCKVSTEPFARGYCSVKQCPNGQWSRGYASLLPGGDVVLKQGLETDRLDLGICGWSEFQLLNDSGGILGYGYNERRCVPAKAPGSARIEDLPPDHIKVPAPIANRVAAIQVTSFCGGDTLAPLGIGESRGPQKPTLSIVIGTPPQ
jgi:S1-C subfamily serine protease